MHFDVVHLICAGLDVHKKSAVAAVAVTDPVTLEATYSVKSFNLFRFDIVKASFIPPPDFSANNLFVKGTFMPS